MHVYVIECKKTSKKYVGSSISDKMNSRIERHKYELQHGVHGNYYMQHSWNLHGPNSFSFDILETIDFNHEKSRHENEAIIRKLEDAWISKLGTLAPYGFNCKTAELCIPTQETRLRMSESQRRRPRITDATRQKLSKAHKGRVYSEVTKQKRSEAQRGEKSHWFGKQHSKETRRKMSESQSGRVISDTHRERLSEANLRQEKIECPHCGKSGKPTPMKRWHFERCRLVQN